MDSHVLVSPHPTVGRGWFLLIPAPRWKFFGDNIFYLDCQSTASNLFDDDAG
jgi:hypothetical protein